MGKNIIWFGTKVVKHQQLHLQKPQQICTKSSSSTRNQIFSKNSTPERQEWAPNEVTQRVLAVIFGPIPNWPRTWTTTGHLGFKHDVKDWTHWFYGIKLQNYIQPTCPQCPSPAIQESINQEDTEWFRIIDQIITEKPSKQLKSSPTCHQGFYSRMFTVP